MICPKVGCDAKLVHGAATEKALRVYQAAGSSLPDDIAEWLKTDGIME